MESLLAGLLRTNPGPHPQCRSALTVAALTIAFELNPLGCDRATPLNQPELKNSTSRCHRQSFS
jgi:hypothetical protein